jgi:hypothetical protein
MSLVVHEDFLLEAARINNAADDADVLGIDLSSHVDASVAQVRAAANTIRSKLLVRAAVGNEAATQAKRRLEEAVSRLSDPMLLARSQAAARDTLAETRRFEVRLLDIAERTTFLREALERPKS